MKVNVSIDLELPSFMKEFEQGDLDRVAFDHVINRLNIDYLQSAMEWCVKMGLAKTEEEKKSFEVMMNTSNMWAEIIDKSSFTVTKS